MRGVRDAVSVDDRVDDVERRELLPEVRGELLTWENPGIPGKYNWQ